MSGYIGTTQELYEACERNAPTKDFLAIHDALSARYGSERADRIYQQTLRDWEFDHWSDEERDSQYPGWRDW